MGYDLFLFDLDDTLFDFKKAEIDAFASVISVLANGAHTPELFQSYRTESERVWRMLELGQISKDLLKTERFKQTFEKNGIEADHVKASALYLEALSESDALVDHAYEICEFLAGKGEIGIATNGFESVQNRRISKSRLKPFISFIAVSEAAGHAKPDARFFEYSIKLAKRFSKESTLMIGDRRETDILGANSFGLSSCWFNPGGATNTGEIKPTHEIKHLSDLIKLAK